MHPLSSSCTFLLAAVLALPVAARAAEPQPASAARPTPEAQQPQQGAPFGAAANDDLLERARGGSDLTVIDTTLTGAVAGNSATNVTTGSNVIQGGSFANMSGMPLVVQNTGANVLIQNAMVINLQLK